jgi:hypothetical protein
LAWGCGSVVECLSRIQKAMVWSSTPKKLSACFPHKLLEDTSSPSKVQTRKQTTLISRKSSMSTLMNTSCD